MSLWTSIPNFRIRRDHALVQTLAMNLAARVFSHFVFVTDSFGATLARRFRWPGEIDTHLDCMNTRYPGLEHVWALGKLETCRIQRRPFCQLDGDVLLIKPLPEWFRVGRMIAQSPDWPHYYYSADIKEAIRMASLGDGFVAYNAGLMGGCDTGLVRAYAEAALDLAGRFVGCSINGTSTSMVIEQYHMGAFAHGANVKITTLLPLNPSADVVADVGYAHLHGPAKRNPKYVQRCERRLREEFPRAWRWFREAWEGIERDFDVQPVTEYVYASSYPTNP